MTVDSQFIISVVCEYYNQELEDLKCNCKLRDLEFVKTRQITMYFLREFTGMSWKRIGEVFFKDHATAMHSFRQVRNQYETYRGYRYEIDGIRSRILNYQKNKEGMSLQYYLMGIYGKQVTTQNIEI